MAKEYMGEYSKMARIGQNSRLANEKEEERFDLSNDREDCGAKNLDTRGATPFSSCGIGRKQWVVGRNGELTTLLSIIIELMMRMVMKMVAVGIRTKQPQK